MTVAEIIEELSKMPPNAKVLINESDGRLVSATKPLLTVVNKSLDWFSKHSMYKNGEQIVVI